MRLSPEKLSNLIKKAGYKKSEFAKAVCIPATDLSRHLSGVNPRPDRIAKFAKALKCHEADLLEDPAESIRLIGASEIVDITYTSCGISRIAIGGITKYHSNNPYIIAETTSLVTSVKLPKALAEYIVDCLIAGLEEKQGVSVS